MNICGGREGYRIGQRVDLAHLSEFSEPGIVLYTYLELG